MSQQDVLMELQQAAATDSVGAQLRQAREARGMSIESVSNAIKLAPRQVEAIESDDFGQLLSPTYARGFIRNYASLIGLDAQSLLGRLDQQHVCATPQLIEQANVGVTMPNQSAHRKWLLPLIALSVPAIVALALYVWFEFWPASPQVVDAITSESEAAAPWVAAPVESSQTLPDVVALPPDAAVEPADASVSPPADVTAPPMAALPGQRQLAFTFATDSWVEMRDASESILFSELNRSGSTRTLNATFPVSLVIGNARSVTLHIDGVPYDLAPSTKVDVARLRLE
jgi:cytoskeleton protein RodZ